MDTFAFHQWSPLYRDSNVFGNRKTLIMKVYLILVTIYHLA